VNQVTFLISQPGEQPNVREIVISWFCTLLFLPSRIQMGRNAIFKPRVCTRADLDVFLEAERTLGGKSKVANRKTRRRVVGDFGRLIAANGFVDPVEGLRFWAGACKNDGLGWGAIDTYSAYISKVISPTLTWSQRGD
jgi:hypothetical protein